MPDQSTSGSWQNGQWVPNTPPPGQGHTFGSQQDLVNANFPWMLGNIQASQQKWKTPALNMSLINTAVKDQSSPFYGLDINGLDPSILQKISNHLGGFSGIKDPMYPQLLADVAKAMTAKDTISANSTRNAALDMRRTSEYGWGQNKDAFQQQLAGTGNSLENSGFAQRQLGEMGASKDSALQQAIMGKVQSDAQTNWDRRQGLIDTSFGNMQNWVSMKKKARQGREQLLNGVLGLQRQASAANTAGQLGAIGGLASGLGSAFGGD